MSPLELVRRLYVAGVDVDLNDKGGIRVSGHTVPDDLLAELLIQKNAVLALMHSQRIGEPDDSAVPVATLCRIPAWRRVGAFALDRVVVNCCAVAAIVKGQGHDRPTTRPRRPPSRKHQ